MKEFFRGIVALSMAGIEVLPRTPEEVAAHDLAKETMREQDAFEEIVARLLKVDAEHPELDIRAHLHTLSERTKGGASPMEDLAAIVRIAEPFLER